jgi:WD40 repeat protein
LIAANAVAVSLQPEVFAVGYHDGLIRLVDCRNASVPLASFSRGSSAVIDLLSSSSTLISSCHDGATTEWSLDGQLNREFSASDCEPVSALSSFQLDDSTFLMSAADDGIIRKYKL